MLLYNEILKDIPVASVQATHQIGTVVEPVIDPRDLSIPALAVQAPRRQGNLLLFTSDVRSMGGKGIIIDHDEQLMEAEGLVRLKEVLNFKFQLIGKRVETEDGNKLGSVSRFAFHADGWKIAKLHVSPTLGKTLGTSGSIIDRQQIVKVSDSRIVVKSAGIKAGSRFSWRRLFLGTAKPALEPETAQTD